MTFRRGTKSFYDRISASYDLIADSSEHIARDRGIELLAITPGETVLVVGFGTGHALVTFARSVGPTGRVFGVDRSEGMFAVAQKRVVESGVADRVEMTIGDARQLAYSPGQFDVVFIAFTLELFDDADIFHVLEEIRRVLRRGGRIGLVAMSSAEQTTIVTWLYIWMHHHFPQWVDCRPIPVAWWLRRAAFQIDYAETVSLRGLPVAVVVARHL